MIYSHQRELILNTLRSTPVHPTADELFALVRQQDSNVSLATVYRNLNQLSAKGMILRIPNPTGADRYDGTTNAHYHAVCKGCGKTFDIFAQMPDVCAAANQQHNICVTEVNMLFGGLCKQCAAGATTCSGDARPGPGAEKGHE